MLQINNLRVEIDGKEILKCLTLPVDKGEAHAITGPNGAGTSMLRDVRGGQPEYDETARSVG